MEVYKFTVTWESSCDYLWGANAMQCHLRRYYLKTSVFIAWWGRLCSYEPFSVI